MMRVLIPYGTSEGHTARIARYLAEVIRNEGYDAYAMDAERATAAVLDGYDAVIVGASVHMGKHERYIVSFVRENRDRLEGLPSAFFSVSLAAHDKTTLARQEVEGYIRKFIQQTGWRPGKVGVFAGALLYTKYSFFKRWIMRKIAREKGSLDLDISRDYVYTDWNTVKRFAEDFLATLIFDDGQIRRDEIRPTAAMAAPDSTST
jgi:menaquinone-dependent protoporphyrinogen oxidase